MARTTVEKKELASLPLYRARGREGGRERTVPDELWLPRAKGRKQASC